MNNTPNVSISKKDLVAYIRELFRLEYKKFSLEAAQKNLLKEIRDLEDLPYDCKPQAEHIEEPKVPSDKPEVKKYKKLGRLCAIIMFWVCVLIGSNILTPIVSDEAQLVGYAVGLIVVSFICSIIVAIVAPKIIAKVIHIKEIKTYNERLDKYNLELSKARDKHDRAIKKWEESCKRIDEQNKSRTFSRNCKNSLWGEMGRAIRETELALNKLYAYDVIYPKYRTYNAIANILCYFESGRVDTLKEALNKYDDDVFRGIVLTSLDDISFKQEMTYSAINDNNNILQNAISGVNTIAAQNSSMLSYQQIAAENSKAILSSVKNVEFLQTIDMMDRLTGR